MSAHCRICNSKGISKGEPLVTCKNCGSLVCDQHHTWWGRSKNAFCVECFPNQVSSSTSGAATALIAVIENQESENGKRINDIIRSALEKSEVDLSIGDLIRALITIVNELNRRTSEG